MFTYDAHTDVVSMHYMSSDLEETSIVPPHEMTIHLCFYHKGTEIENSLSSIDKLVKEVDSSLVNFAVMMKASYLGHGAL